MIRVVDLTKSFAKRFVTFPEGFGNLVIREFGNAGIRVVDVAVSFIWRFVVNPVGSWFRGAWSLDHVLELIPDIKQRIALTDDGGIVMAEEISRAVG